MFENLQNSQKNIHCKMLVYGVAGTGKTCLALSHPGKIYILDYEKGSNLYADIADNVYIQPISSWVQLNEALAFLKTVVTPEDCILFDSETLFYDDLQCVRANFETSDAKKVGKLNLGDWGVIKKIVKDTHMKLNNFKCDVIATSHEKVLLNNEGIQMGYVPSCEQNVPHYFDYTFRLLKNEDKITMILDKERSDKVDFTELDITNKTFSDIFGNMFSRNATISDILKKFKFQIMYAKNKAALNEVKKNIKESNLPEESLQVLRKMVTEKSRRIV